MTSPYQTKNFIIDSVGVRFNDGSAVYIDKGSILQLEYREGLFHKFLTVTLNIMDTTALISNVIIGMEMFEVVFTDVKSGVKFEFTTNSTNGPLYAYNIHSKSINDTGKSFVVELCRKDAILSMQKRVCKKYKEVTSSTLVGEIIQNELGNKKKSIRATNSLNKLTFIPPNSRPLDVLIWARSKFIGEDQTPDKEYYSAGFLFYETYKHYNYVSIDRIARQRDYKVVLTTGTGTSTNQDAFRVENPRFENSIDMVRNFDRGFYSGQIEFFDVVNCTMTTKKYTLKELYPKWKKIAGGDYLGSMNSPALKSDLEPKGDNSPQIHSPYATRNMMVAYNSDLFATLDSSKEDDLSQFQDTVLQSVSRLGVFMSQVLTVTCSIGNMNLHAADPIFIEFFDSQGNLDSNHSGRYVIADLTHIYTRSEDKFKTNLTLIRDSFGL
jgi:hypothetical protein